jgi:hypothetical protein
MFILKTIVDSIQVIFQKSSVRGKWLTGILLAIIFPMSGSRSSQILRFLKTILGFCITRRSFYIFMVSPKLPWDKLWQCIWKLILSSLTEGRLLLAADDSINPKTGKHIYHCDYNYDHAAKANQSKYVWSQNIVGVGLLKWIHGRFVCLPLSFCFYRLKKSMETGFKTKIEQVIERVLKIHGFFKYPVLLVVDNWFAAKTLVLPLRKTLRNEFHLLSRLRTNTKLYSQRLPRYKGRDRPPKYGELLGNVKLQGKRKKSLAKIFCVFLYGKQREVKAYSKILCLKTLGMPVRVVFVYYNKNMVALFTTDLSLSIEKIIEYYGAPWKIKSGFKELKQDIASQSSQGRSKSAVTNHLNFCMIAVTIIWIYAARMAKQPVRRNSNHRGASFTFSDVRFSMSQIFSQKDFLRVLFKSHKTIENNFFSVLFQLAA